VQWTVVTSSLVDGIFIAGMALVTGGLDSVLFWLFVVLIIRNSVSVPPGVSQLILNFCHQPVLRAGGGAGCFGFQNLDEFTRSALDLTSHEDLGQPFVLRLVVLLLTTICCSGWNCCWNASGSPPRKPVNLPRAKASCIPPDGSPPSLPTRSKIRWPSSTTPRSRCNAPCAKTNLPAAQQIEIIQEEVARADKVITQIMGYAQLSEGRVEKLNVIEEIDRAITQVFPPAVPTG
jgi:hypothetical protein